MGWWIEDRSVRCRSICCGGVAAMCCDLLAELGFSVNSGVYREYDYRIGGGSSGGDWRLVAL